MEKGNLELRLYSLVMYQLSGIQKGIQMSHANDNYSLDHPGNLSYQEWKEHWKTYIILNGGTSNDCSYSGSSLGTMEHHFVSLQQNKIICSHFREPDLNNAMSAIVFLVDERVFNKTKYPDFEFKSPYPKQDPNSSIIYGSHSQLNHEEPDPFTVQYNSWVESVGGESNVFLRDFLKPLRLA